MIDAKEIAGLLARDTRSVAKMLLPAGVERDREWCVGSAGGEPGKSLKIRLDGDHAGLWKDWADGARGGDLLDLWAVTRNLSISEAMKEARAYLGLRTPAFAGTKPRAIKPLEKPPCKALQADGARWLETERSLSPEAIAAYKLAQKGSAILFPYLDPQGRLLFVKYRAIGTKKVWSEKGGTPSLFGWQAIPPLAREVVICEGELDALAWMSYGYPALSVPTGAGGMTWIETEFDNLRRFDRIYLSVDKDGAGWTGAGELVTRLGRERCLFVDLPHKDANDCLRAEVSQDVIRTALRDARTLDPEELRPAGDYLDAVIREFYPADQIEPGITLPWRKSGNMRLRPGEVSLLAGINGHGKSQMAGQLTLEAMTQGWLACVASLEFKPHKWLRRLVRQAGTLAMPSQQLIERTFQWLDGKLWVFDVVGTAKADKLVEVFRYAARRYGIRFFIVDNLAKCGFDEDDYNGQKRFIDRLTDFAKEHDSHVLVCVHMRKGESEHRRPDKMDVKGTGALVDMTDTLMSLWRNKPKEEARRKHEAEQSALPIDQRTPFPEEEAPDAILRVPKQRNGDEEPVIPLWFHPESSQYLGYPTERSYHYTPEETV